MAENSEIKMWNFVISVQQLMENVDDRNSNLRFWKNSVVIWFFPQQEFL